MDLFSRVAELEARVEELEKQLATRATPAKAAAKKATTKG